MSVRYMKTLSHTETIMDDRQSNLNKKNHQAHTFNMICKKYDKIEAIKLW